MERPRNFASHGQPLPRRLLAFEPRIHPLCFIDLCWPIDCPGDALSDSRKPPTERGFTLSELVVERCVTRREQPGDSGDAQKRISLKDEGDEELTGGEFRLVEGRVSRVGRLPVTVATPDTVGTVEGVEAVSTAVRTGSCFPDSLETPLDDSVERLGPKFYYAQFRKFR